MANFVSLENLAHADLRVDRRYGADFGDAVNQTAIFPTEFSNLQREYPIFFRKDLNEEYYSIALLGLDSGRNLFLENSKWNARHIPAMHKRGPFRINAPTPGGHDPVVQVDLDDPRVGEQEGEPLFLPHGGMSPYLEFVRDALRTLHVGAETSRPMFEALASLDLLESVTLRLKISDTETYSVPDLFSIDEEKFANLSADNLKAMHKSGLLALCFWVLASRPNVNRLIEMKRREAH